MKGDLIIPADELRIKLENIKALVFDWDGIFNSGEKGQVPSTFNEIDSMGVNMLRFGYSMMSGKNPIAAIVTGARNETAIQWAQREHLHAVYLNVKHKEDVIPKLKASHGITEDEILFVFDDIHDLSLAKRSGIRILVQNPGASKFVDYCRRMKYFDYMTANRGNDNAVREISEMILDQIGMFEKTIEYRAEFNDTYQAYLQKRNEVYTHIEEF